MTIAHGYLSGTGTVAGVAITGETSFSLDDGTTTMIETKSDGELREQRTVIIPENSTGSIATRNLETTAAVGTTGALSLTATRRTGGVAAGQTVTIAAASCTITQVSRGTDINGNTTVNVSFRVNSPDGIGTGVTITSA
jgi:hypothetical protein